jgi:hypothetical protein
VWSSRFFWNTAYLAVNVTIQDTKILRSISAKPAFHHPSSAGQSLRQLNQIIP